MAAIGKWVSSYNMRERYPCYELKEKISKRYLGREISRREEKERQIEKDWG